MSRLSIRCVGLAAAASWLAWASAVCLAQSGQAAPSRPAYRNAVPVTEPTSAVKVPRIAIPTQPEYVVTDRRATFHRDEQAGWYVLTFLPADGQPDLGEQRVMPSRMLTALEQAREEYGDPTFVISGQSTRYRGNQYILVERLLVAQVEAPMPEPAPQQTAPPIQAPVQSDAAAAAPTSGDVFDRMMKDVPGRPVAVVTHDAPPIEPTSIAPGASKQAFQADRGDAVIDRLGFITHSVSQPGWFEFHFVSDNTLGDSPLLILPSQLLANSESSSRKVRMSGQILRYRGRTYLMLRKLLKERNLDQF